MLALPPSTEVTYVAEGAANIIYRFVSTASSPIDSALEGKLLRLRKDIPHGVPYVQTVDNFDTKIRSLFSESQLVSLQLVQLPPSFIDRCNQQLRLNEKTIRPPKRHGTFLAPDEPHGLLVTDMTTHAQTMGEELIEFKPKWLLQSPSAPKNALRCRTCAFRDLRQQNVSFCPLDIISENYDDVVQAVSHLKTRRKDELARFLFKNQLLERLRAQQLRYNAVGLNHDSPSSYEVSLSMTIRDCTLFIRVS